MSLQRITGRYAKSILDLAQEQGQLAAVVEDVMDLKDLFANSRDLYLMVKSPIIKPDAKTKAMQAIFDAKVQPILMEFIKIVIRKGRESLLPEIIEEVIRQYRKRTGTEVVHVRSAAPLSELAEEMIKTKLINGGLKASKVELRTEVDASLIGGFVLEYGDMLYDASIQHKLQKMSKALTQS